MQTVQRGTEAGCRWPLHWQDWHHHPHHRHQRGRSQAQGRSGICTEKHYSGEGQNTHTQVPETVWGIQRKIWFCKYSLLFFAEWKGRGTTTMQPLCAEWLGNDFTMVGEWLHNGWGMTSQWLGNDFTMVGEWLHNGWGMTSQWLGNDFRSRYSTIWSLKFGETGGLLGGLESLVKMAIYKAPSFFTGAYKNLQTECAM